MRADESQIENAILNLAINARDAMPGGGKLTVRTANVDRESCPADLLAPGEYVALAVSDSGTGMAPDIVARAFDPFFTTKGGTGGSGLGLSMVHGFVRQSGGDIEIDSETGRGSTLTLYFPRARGKAESLAEAPEGPTTGGGETILVVEDDADIRDLTVAVLTEIGYGARAAADADAALRSLDAAPDVDLLLTDIVLPGQTSGLDLAQRVRARRPAIKILLTSGYIDPAEHRAALGGLPVLRKPYRRDDLARKVRSVLGRRA